MKKLNYLFGLLMVVFCVIIFSCSSDDNDTKESSKEELLLGKWKRIRKGRICGSGTESIQELSTCKQKGTITFNSDGTYHEITYMIWNNDCVIDGEYKGTWELKNNEFYIIVEGETIARKVQFFELSEKILKLGLEFGEPCDGENSPSQGYTEFVKI